MRKLFCCDLHSRSLLAKYLRFRLSWKNISALHNNSILSLILWLGKDGVQWRCSTSFNRWKTVRIYFTWAWTLLERPNPSWPVQQLPRLSSYQSLFSQTHVSMALVCTRYSLPVVFCLVLTQYCVSRRLCHLDDYFTWIPTLSSFQLSQYESGLPSILTSCHQPCAFP